MSKRSLIGLSILGLVLLAAPARAMELSFLSGLYKSESDKVNGDDAGGKATIELGGRLGGEIDQRFHWFGESNLTLRTYDEGDSGDAPDNSTSLALGGGVRYYFSRFSEFSVPFTAAFARFKTDKNAEQDLTGITETESTGLYYGGRVGIRFGLDQDFFLDLETPLFESALFAQEKTELTTPAGVKTKFSKSRTDIYLNTTGALSSMVVALGLKL